MFKTIQIQNFRGFQDLTISGLSTINVLTGLNGTGKTTILEATFLISGAANAALIASIYSFRGDTRWTAGNDLPFVSIFRNLDPSVIPTISASSSLLMKTAKKYYRELTIKPTFSTVAGAATTQQTSKLSGVEFVFRGASGVSKNSFGWKTNYPSAGSSLNSDGKEQINPTVALGGDPTPNPDLIHAQFISPYYRDLPEQDSDSLVQLVKERRIPEVVEILKIIDPRVKNIQPLTENNLPVVYVDIGESKMLPITLLGSGLSNVLHIALPLVLHKGATILIDEFEDGLHHTLFRPLLNIVFSLAQKNNNQIFISTHSEEFLRELLLVCKEKNINEEIAFYRLAQRKFTGNLSKFSLSEIGDLLDSNLDVR
jgi:AAA15 family ATPase/GTPase